jgi:hypothetical protein
LILHSIVSPYDIFCNKDGLTARPEYRRVPGGTVEISDGRIKRLISTDPRMFLNEKYKPDTAVGKQ